MSIRDLVKPHIRDLAPYQPGKPMEELERELGISESVKLASNENPLGPSPKAVEAIRTAAAAVHRYPDAASFKLRAKLAARLGVGEDQLVFGTGCDEVIELIAKTFIGTGDEVVYPWPSFAMYPIVVSGMGGTPVEIPLAADLDHDLEAMADAITDQTRVVMVCNPNNPTGVSFGAKAFERFVARIPDHVVLAIDEVYVEFARRADFPNSLELIARRPATIALRSFSKIYGIAGVRIGYGITSPELANYLERARHPFNVNLLAQAGAAAALDDEDHFQETLALNASGGDYLRDALEQLGIQTWPSDANFILAKTGPGVYEGLLSRGIIIRPMSAFGLTEHVRISIGLPEENERLVKAITELVGPKDAPGGEA